MSIRFAKYCGRGCKSAHTHYKDGEDVTRQGLAYTPADMERMQAHGMPVRNPEIESMYYDGDTSNDFNVTSDRVRYNDVNDLWEENQAIRARARSAYKASKASKASKSAKSKEE